MPDHTTLELIDIQVDGEVAHVTWAHPAIRGGVTILTFTPRPASRTPHLIGIQFRTTDPTLECWLGVNRLREFPLDSATRRSKAALRDTLDAYVEVGQPEIDALLRGWVIRSRL